MAITIDLSGKTALVTGGTRGIGNAIAHTLRRAGAEVAITGTREKSDYTTDLTGLAYHRVDSADEAAISALAAATPRLDILVNNAGIVFYKKQEWQLETFRRVIDVNLAALMHYCNSFHGHLKQGPGTVVNLTSVTAFFGTFGNPAYGASKAAIVQLTQTLAVAWGRDGIRVNAVAPGFTETEMTEVSQKNKAINDAIVSRTPLGRWGRPQDIADAVLYFASDRAGFVTGQTLLVDGGYASNV